MKKGRITTYSELKLESVSLVGSPKCEKCGAPMKAFDDYRWECPGCDPGEPVHVGGVYPFRVVER